MKIKLRHKINEAPEDQTVPQPVQQVSFEEDPMNYILMKYPSLKETLTILMSDAFKDYLNGIYVVAPRPTTFKIVLHNNQEFILTWTGKTYSCKVEGKKYYLSFLSDKQRATAAIAQLLELGAPIGKPGPEKEEGAAPQEPEEEEGGGEEAGGGEEETGGEGETLEESTSKKKVNLKLLVENLQILLERNLDAAELTRMSRYIPRIKKIYDKVEKKDPFELADGQKVVLQFAKPEYKKLFSTDPKNYPNHDPKEPEFLNQAISDAFAQSVENTPFEHPNKVFYFKDDKGNKYTLRDLKKTPEFGGSGGSKADTTERQERGLIDIINSIPGEKTIISANGSKLEGVLSAEKVEGRNVKGVEPYSDVKLIVKGKKAPVLVSAKGPSAPTLGSGGIKGITALTADNQNPAIVTGKLQGKNLYKNPAIQDVSRKVPADIIKTLLVGTPEMGGPVSYYYIGEMDVKHEKVGKNTIKLSNGDFIPLSSFIKKKGDKLYAHIRKRDGDLFFTDEKQDLNGTKIPKIFSTQRRSKTGTGSQESGGVQSRFGMVDKIRGVEI